MSNHIEFNLIKPLLSDLLKVKQSLSRINGVITKLAELSFIEFLLNRNLIDHTEYANYAAQSIEGSAYANGYDCYIPEKGVVAEIKALIPYGENRFGGAQIQSLVKDIEGMLTPNTKTKKQVNPQDCMKFLALLSSQNESTFTEAVKHLIAVLTKKGYNVTDIIPKNNDELIASTVYIVIMPLS